MGKNRFCYPTGARPLLIEETARRRRIESRFVSLLEDAGFAEVVLPIIDYAEPYAETVDGKRSYRFVDREGELIAVRSDFTPMVARALAPALDELPLRVFYRGDVIRCEPSRLGANRELFQIGAEIIGDGSVDADVEVLRLAAALVRTFGIEPLVVYSAPRPLPLDDDAFVLHPEDDEPPGYYTGLRFHVYSAAEAAAAPLPIAAGGRYDSLYARFGQAAPAVGFTFTIDDLD